MKRVVATLLLAAWGGSAVGCAAASRTVTPAAQQPATQPVTQHTRKGELYLSMHGSQWPKFPHRGAGSVGERLASGTVGSQRAEISVPMITAVQVNGRSGESLATVALPVSSEAALVEVLKGGLAEAGFEVKVVRKLPENAERGVDVSWTYTALELRPGVRGGTPDGRCQIRFRLDTWRRGRQWSSHSYRASRSGFVGFETPERLVRLMTDTMTEASGEVATDLTDDLFSLAPGS